MSKDMQEAMFIEFAMDEFNKMLGKEVDIVKDLSNCMLDMIAVKSETFVNPDETADKMIEISERYIELERAYGDLCVREKDFLSKFTDIYKKKYGE